MKQTKVAEGIIAEDGGALLRKRIAELEWDKEALQLAGKWLLWAIDVLYAAPQAHEIVNITLHREYYPGIIFIISQGRKNLYHV
jgi:hypothetical protein